MPHNKYYEVKKPSAPIFESIKDFSEIIEADIYSATPFHLKQWKKEGETQILELEKNLDELNSTKSKFPLIMSEKWKIFNEKIKLIDEKIADFESKKSSTSSTSDKTATKSNAISQHNKENGKDEQSKEPYSFIEDFFGNSLISSIEKHKQKRNRKKQKQKFNPTSFSSKNNDDDKSEIPQITPISTNRQTCQPLLPILHNPLLDLENEIQKLMTEFFTLREKSAENPRDTDLSQKFKDIVYQLEILYQKKEALLLKNENHNFLMDALNNVVQYFFQKKDFCIKIDSNTPGKIIYALNTSKLLGRNLVENLKRRTNLNLNNPLGNLEIALIRTTLLNRSKFFIYCNVKENNQKSPKENDCTIDDVELYCDIDLEDAANILLAEIFARYLLNKGKSLTIDALDAHLKSIKASSNDLEKKINQIIENLTGIQSAIDIIPTPLFPSENQVITDPLNHVTYTLCFSEKNTSGLFNLIKNCWETNSFEKLTSQIAKFSAKENAVYLTLAALGIFNQPWQKKEDLTCFAPHVTLDKSGKSRSINQSMIGTLISATTLSLIDTYHEAIMKEDYQNFCKTSNPSFKEKLNFIFMCAINNAISSAPSTPLVTLKL